MSAATSPPRNRQYAFIHFFEKDGEVRFSAHFDPPLEDESNPARVPNDVEAAVRRAVQAIENGAHVPVRP